MFRCHFTYTTPTLRLFSKGLFGFEDGFERVKNDGFEKKVDEGKVVWIKEKMNEK